MGDTTDVSRMFAEAMRAAESTDFSRKNGAGDKRPRTTVIGPAAAPTGALIGIEREYPPYIGPDYDLYDSDGVPLEKRCFQCDILFGLWLSARRSVLAERQNGIKSFNLTDDERARAKDRIAHSIRYASLKGITGRLGETWPASLEHWDICPLAEGETFIKGLD